jgi:hypothetical protein
MHPLSPPFPQVFYKNTPVEPPTPWGVRLHDITFFPIQDMRVYNQHIYTKRVDDVTLHRMNMNVYAVNTNVFIMDQYDLMGSNPPPPGGFDRCVFIEDLGGGGDRGRMTSYRYDVMWTCYSRYVCLC